MLYSFCENGAGFSPDPNIYYRTLLWESVFYRFPFFRFLSTRKIASPATRNSPIYSPSCV